VLEHRAAKPQPGNLSRTLRDCMPQCFGRKEPGGNKVSTGPFGVCEQ